eukprot:364508-Chlamydomonas_euryale.AAC.20
MEGGAGTPCCSWLCRCCCGSAWLAGVAPRCAGGSPMPASSACNSRAIEACDRGCGPSPSARTSAVAWCRVTTCAPPATADIASRSDAASTRPVPVGSAAISAERSASSPAMAPPGVADSPPAARSSAAAASA